MAAFLGAEPRSWRMLSAVWVDVLRPRCIWDGETARRSKASLSWILRRIGSVGAGSWGIRFGARSVESSGVGSGLFAGMHRLALTVTRLNRGRSLQVF